MELPLLTLQVWLPHDGEYVNLQGREEKSGAGMDSTLKILVGKGISCLISFRPGSHYPVLLSAQHDTASPMMSLRGMAVMVTKDRSRRFLFIM